MTARIWDVEANVQKLTSRKTLQQNPGRGVVIKNEQIDSWDKNITKKYMFDQNLRFSKHVEQDENNPRWKK